MVVVDPVAALLFDAVEGLLKHFPPDHHFCSAFAADQMMMALAGKLVGQVTIQVVSSKDDAVTGQKVQRAIDGGFGHTRLADTGIDFGGREMTIVVQGFEDGQPLGSHAVAADAQGLRMNSQTGHGFLITKNINRYYMQKQGNINNVLASS